MPTNEKEVNNYLFDQLSQVERIEEAVETGDMEIVKKVLERIKFEVKRKLYQNPGDLL